MPGPIQCRYDHNCGANLFGPSREFIRYTWIHLDLEMHFIQNRIFK